MTVLGIVLFIAQRESDIIDVLSHLSLSLVVLSLGATLLAKVATAEQMGHSLRLAGAHATLGERYRLYSFTDMAKYAPGGLWGFVGRVWAYNARGMTRIQILRALMLEHAWLVGGAALSGAFLYLTGLVLGAGNAGPSLWVKDLIPFEFRGNAVLGAVLVVAVVTLLAFVALAGRITLKATLPIYDLARATVTLALAWAVIGMGFAVLLPVEIYGVSGVLLTAGAFNVGFAAGFVAIFAPAGIGVRELVVGALLWPGFDLDVIAAALLASRVVWFLSDVTFAATVLLLTGSRRRDCAMVARSNASPAERLSVPANEGSGS